MFPKKIVIIGPESTGKSEISKQLAAQFNGCFVPEYARQYLQQNGVNYEFNDLYTIAQGQLKLEQSISSTCAAQHIFIDTDLYVIKVWSEFVFNKCDNRILTEIAQRKYDLYLLMNTDLPWQKDDLREYPDLKTREILFRHYKELLSHQSVPWAIIRGQGHARLQAGIRAVETLLV